jgi:serine/threonine protein kinase
MPVADAPEQQPMIGSTVAAQGLWHPEPVPPFRQNLPQLPGLDIAEILGQGGMGVVYKAWQHSHERWVAVKVIRKDRQTNPDLVKRFHREAQAAARLSHPNFVLVHEASLETEPYYLVMEYVHGITLQQLITDRGPLPIAHACEYVRQVAQGLQHASDQGLVHRDIKPSNLMIMRPGTDPDAVGMVKILDMGVVKLCQLGDSAAEMLSTLTQKGSLLGTLDFIAPEQLEDARGADARADLYSLGCTFYYLLTGQVPFPDPNPIRKVDSHRWQIPAAVDQLRPEIQAAIAAVVRKLMAKKPPDRYQTPAELVADLERAARGDRVSVALRPAPVAELRRFTGHTDAVWSVALAADGKRAVSGGKDQVPRLWDVDSGDLVASLPEQPQQIRAVSIAPNGRLLALAVGAGIRLLEIEGGQEVVRCTGHTDIVRAVAFTPDGQRLLSCSDDRTARVWDARSGRELLRFARHRGSVSSLAVSADGEQVVTGGRDSRVRLWGVRNGRELAEFTAHAGQVLAVALARSGRYAVSAHFDTLLRLWDVATGRELRRLPGHRQMVTCAGITPDDGLLVSGSQDQTLRVWDLHSGAEVRCCVGHTAGVTSLSLAPVARQVLSASVDGTLRLWPLPAASDSTF